MSDFFVIYMEEPYTIYIRRRRRIYHTHYKHIIIKMSSRIIFVVIVTRRRRRRKSGTLAICTPTTSTRSVKKRKIEDLLPS